MNKCTSLVTTNEIRVSCVDIACLHTIQLVSHEGFYRQVFLYLRNHICYKLHGRAHRLLEEVDHDSIEAFSKGWISSESLLQNNVKHKYITQQGPQVTYNFGEKLAKNANQLIVNQLTTFKAWFLETFDLLFHDDFKSGRPHEQCWCGTLNNISISSSFNQILT